MHILSFFFLMIRRPPRSTLFPTRRSSDLLYGTTNGQEERDYLMTLRKLAGRDERIIFDGEVTEANRRKVLRSEEHTSELQSLAYLVCRLLLEKKKQRTCTPH